MSRAAATGGFSLGCVALFALYCTPYRRMECNGVAITLGRYSYVTNLDVQVHVSFC